MVENPGEIPWVDMTLDWLKRLGIQVKHENHRFYQIFGGAKINGFHYIVPADFSSAAFPLAAALLTRSSLVLSGLNLDDCQGDKMIFPILEQMGARFTLHDRMVTIHENGPLKGATIDINGCIDALPILAVIATHATTPTEIYNASIARTKETDRIFAISQELRKMGAIMEEKPDGLIIHPSKLNGAHLTSYSDHRIAMSLTVAALSASSPSTIDGVECMEKTYGSFVADLKNLGANIE
jgi:3-phosphoshikimate 1-carboxyvinyltransferase